MQKKRKREIDIVVAQAHLTLRGIRQNGSSHLVLEVEAPNGKRATFSAAATPSDWRSDKNKISELKRFARENQKVI